MVSGIGVCWDLYNMPSIIPTVERLHTAVMYGNSTMEITGDSSILPMYLCGGNYLSAPELQWQWYDHPVSEVRIVGFIVTFHPVYSQGTDIDYVDLTQLQFQFVSALGINALPRLFLYDDKIQNDAIQLQSGQKSSHGCVMGIYLYRTSSMKT
uniref:Uncharacterized protein n=1 Tax=Glossina pallidipes TaxID=7398 RepID=A0A1A9ZFG8_GLOPL